MRRRRGGATLGAVTEADEPATGVDRITVLIELGRDREAAELAGEARQERQTTRRGTMDVFSQLDQLGPLLGGVAGNIKPDQLENPTPCAKYTVRGVFEHMIGGATTFAAAFRGVEAAPPDTGDVLEQFGPVLTDLVTAIREPGALDQTIQTPMGEMPAEAFARFIVVDGLVHGWDLAQATGQPYDPPEALVTEVDAFARQAIPQAARDGDTFAEEVDAPPSATPIERLVAFTGRQP
jgi:uncharacterized protein (TIGR03086 family)